MYKILAFILLLTLAIIQAYILNSDFVEVLKIISAIGLIFSKGGMYFILFNISKGD